MEEVQHFQPKLDPLGRRVSEQRVHQRRRSGALRVVLDQRPRPEMAHAQAGAQPSQLVRGAGGQGAAGRARNVLTTGEAGARQGEVGVGRESG